MKVVVGIASIALLACGTYATFTPLHVPPRAMSPRSAESVELITDGTPIRAADHARAHFVDGNEYTAPSRTPALGHSA